jgi:hypothetical protein
MMTEIVLTPNDDVSSILSNSPGDCSYVLDDGIYPTDDTAVIGKSNLTIAGRPGAIVQRDTTRGMWRFEDCQNITLHGLVFDACGVDRYGGVSFLRCDEVRIRDCRYTDSDPQPGTDYDRYSFVFRSDEQPSEKVWIENCAIDHLQLQVNSVRDTHIVGNVIEDSPTFGISLCSANNGLAVENVWVERNVIKNAAKRGLYIGLDTGNLTDNVFRNLFIERNSILDSVLTGIFIGSNHASDESNLFENIRVVGNAIEVSAREAVYFYAPTGTGFVFNVHIEGNRIQGAPVGYWMIDARRLMNSIVADSIILNANYGIIVAASQGTNVARDNLVEAATLAYSLDCLSRDNDEI